MSWLPGILFILVALLCAMAIVMFRERRNGLEQIRTSREHFRLIAEHSSDVIWLFDLATLRYTYVSPAVQKLRGFTPDEVIALPLEVSLSKEGASQIWQHLSSRLSAFGAGDESQRYQVNELEQKHKDGSSIVTEVSSTLLCDDKGTPVSIIGVSRDISDRREREDALVQTQQRLKISEQRWSFALEGAGDGVWDLNSHTGEVMFSRRFKEVLGYAEDEIENHAGEWMKRVHPDDLRRVMADVKAYYRIKDGVGTDGKAATHACEYRMQCKDGNWKWVMTRGKVMRRDENGKPLRMIGTLTDVTERREREEAMRSANEALQEANFRAEAASRAKSDFLSNMSHEIRTPMNSVLGMAYLALRTVLDPKQRDYIEKIHRSGEHLLGIIDDILDFSKIEAGMLRVEVIDFELSGVFRNLTDLVAGKATEKGLKMAFDIAAGLPEQLCGDPLRLGQVLINYANNAIKFTEQGEVTVRAMIVEEGASDCLVRFEVADSGIGISLEQQAHLFQSFQQADTSTTRKFGGSGLGLAISRQLVLLMGGEVGVQSQPGQGSTFWFTARLGKHESGAGQPSQPKAASQDAGILQKPLTGMHVLVADDNPVNRLVASRLLEYAGATIGVASDGQEALDMLRQQRFDCVLMDIQMPGIDGLEATRQIRADPLLKQLPVIAMTASGWGDERARCLEAGMNDFVSKPMQPDPLCRTLLRWRAPDRATVITDGALPGVPEPGEKSGSVPDADLIDLTVLARKVGNDEDKVRELAYRFLGSARECISQIEALHQRKNLTAIGPLVQRTMLAAKGVGAAGFAELCSHLERASLNENEAELHEIVVELPLLLERIAGQIKKKCDMRKYA